MGNAFLVGVGGFIGSVLRYGLSGLVHEWTGRDDFPVGTLAVNVLGCLVIGLLAELAEARVLRGLMGYGAHSRLHTFKIERLSLDLPIIIELVDTREKLERFLAFVDNEIEEGLATLEKAQIHFYRSGKPS